MSSGRSSGDGKGDAGGIPGIAYLWISILVFAASNSIVRVLTDLGAAHPIDGRNPISFCNVLFAGNVCSLAGLLAIHGRDLNRRSLRALAARDWLALAGVGFLTSALAPAFSFIALESTMVTTVVLVSQLEPPLALALTWIVFREKISGWGVIGAGICFAGVALSVLLQSDSGVMIGRGELYAAGAAVTYAVSTIIARPALARIPTGIFAVVRNLVGTVSFFAVVVVMYGPEHFMDVTSSYLWGWMLVYGGVIVVGGQLAWYAGLRKARFEDVSLASSATPVAGILAALLILGEIPNTAQLLGGGVLLAGLAVGWFGTRRETKAGEARRIEVGDAARFVQESHRGTGFQGV